MLDEKCWLWNNMFKIEQYTNVHAYLYSKFWLDNTYNISKGYPWQAELQLFKIFVCIFLYFQGLFYNKCKKVNMFIFLKVNRSK